MDVREYIDRNAPVFFGALREWLAIPSISADPARHGDVRRSAEWLAGHLRETGFPVAEVWETGGLPAVFAYRDDLLPYLGPGRDPRSSPAPIGASSCSLH